MTRATLLQILDHPTAIDTAEVHELEQLAQAFPYCQTAHLLLAKAAHDQGTMMASQRLRRAATYAADRELLRHLIEQVPEAAEQLVEATSAPAPEPALPELLPVAVVPEPVAEPAAPQPEMPMRWVKPAPAPAPLIAPEIPEVSVPTAPEPIIDLPELVVAESVAAAVVEPAAVIPEPVLEAPAVVVEEVIEVVPAPVLEVETETIAAAVAAEPEVAESEEAPADEANAVVILPENPSEVVITAEILEVEIPAAAPPIRPPEEVGSARFEFGLQEESKPAAPVYELPGLVDEWAAAATTLALRQEPVIFELPAPARPVAPHWSEAAFTGDEAVGYSLGEGSRLGFGLGLLAEVVLAKIDAEEAASVAFETAAAPVAATLPPTAAFFEPDVLLLEHWATHRPTVIPTPSSLDLINNFLRRQPRLTRPAMLPPSPTAQADLSVKSTRTEPELASEGLARILARQGKTERAIEIYQRLMVKQPEKMAYFAAQIQQLQPSA